MARIDLDVDNEATGFTITSRSLCGRDLSAAVPADEAWMDAVADGVFLPFELVQDDAFIIRVVVDEPLGTREADEWVACTRHKLRIPDGRLLVMGGGEEYFQGEDMEDFTRSLAVPPGDYLAEVYTYLHGVNGDYALNAAGPPEPSASYFRRTRPGEPFPRWLGDPCRHDPRLDPGHEEDWADAGAAGMIDEGGPRFIDFLLRLSSGSSEEAASLPTVRGMFGADAGARRPAACPIGIPAEIPGDPTDDDRPHAPGLGAA